MTFHAHPDDEAIFTGGTIVRAAQAGWRVVLVVATAGESGRAPAWVNGDLAAHRRAETEASARLLGVERVEFLGYRDSGIDLLSAEADAASAHRDGETDDVPTLSRASVLEAAERLHRILIDEHAAVLTSYDADGIYGHRDHVRVHEIAAASVLDTLCDLVEATVSRPVLRSMRTELMGRGLEPDTWPAQLIDRIGVDDAGELLAVDVAKELPRKLQAMAAHASQVIEAPNFMGLPPGAFHRLLSVEWFRPARVIDGRFSELVSAAPSA